jgi:[ribosomal protein S18]-alanine N-acetyltransferase
MERRPVRVLKMRCRDLRGVARVGAKAYRRRWSTASFLKELARPSRVSVVARAGRHVVGYGKLTIVGRDAVLVTLAVDPDWRRQKVASELMLRLVRTGIRLGADNVRLEVRMSNAGARAFYRRFGFQVTEVCEDLFPEENEGGLVMRVDNIASPALSALLDRIAADLR